MYLPAFHSHAGYAADWWSVGIILFELITGIPPFNAESPEVSFILRTLLLDGPNSQWLGWQHFCKCINIIILISCLYLLIVEAASWTQVLVFSIPCLIQLHGIPYAATYCLQCLKIISIFYMICPLDVHVKMDIFLEVSCVQFWAVFSPW